MAQEIQTLQPQERLSLMTQPQPFISAFESVAKSDTFIGDLGATMAQQASIQYNRNRGLEYGMNPQGDLLPSITQADQAFKEGYLAQSQNTLSLQANQMFNQAEEQLSKSYKLSQGQINEFQSQMSQGLDKIMSVAPTEVRTNLSFQYQRQLDNTASQYRSKLINQAKSDALDAMKVNDKLTDKNINDLATSGKAQDAKALYEGKIKQNLKQFNSGMMTRSEMEASNSSAKITYYQGIYNSQLIQLEQQTRNDSKESRDQRRGEFLSQFIDYNKRPKDLSADEWTTLGNNTLAFQQHLNNMESIAVNYAFSDLNLKAAQGTITNMDIQSVANMPGVSDTQMNDWLARFKATKAGESRENSLTSQILSDYSNRQVWAETTSDKAKDNAYFSVVARQAQENPNAMPLQNEAYAASVAGGPVPAFNRVIENYSRSNNPQDMRAASNAYQVVARKEMGNLFGLSKDTTQRLEAFNAITRMNPGMSDDEALQRIRIAENRTQDEKKLIQQNWIDQTQGAKGSLATFQSQKKEAKKLLGISGIFTSSQMLNESSTTANIMSILKSNYDFVGNYDEALEMTRESVKTIFGESKVNGENYTSMYPLEKMANLDNSHFFFQRDIVEQLNQKFEQQKVAAQNGLSANYYRIKNIDKYDLDIAPLKPFAERVTQDKYDSIMKNAEPIEVEIVSIVNGKEKVTDTANLIVDISQETQLSYDPNNPVSGAYDIGMSHKSGYSSMLTHYGPYNPTLMTYTPNFNKVKKSYDDAFGRFGRKPMSNMEEIQAMVMKLTGKGVENAEQQ
jgi:hypothetical protein